MTLRPATDPAPKRSVRIVVTAAVLVGLAAALVLGAERDWLPSAMMALAAVTAGLVTLLRLPGTLVAMLAVASVVNGASIAWNWYAAWPPFDEWAHLLNLVVLVAPSMVWFARAGIVTAAAGSMPSVVIAAAYGLALAVAWEVVELFFWTFPLWDTVSDVILGVVGAAFAGWWVGRLEAGAGACAAPPAGAEPL